MSTMKDLTNQHIYWTSMMTRHALCYVRSVYEYDVSFNSFSYHFRIKRCVSLL